ncbi:MAG TPA: electron transfer flavoprotein subunit beta/FixA family protein [Bacillota bacterium]|mgnify:CR=1 FL=1|jgi:electron transfer flavoprotein alpha/beta subunit|nr:electron transfer flavoprotein subunit beta/FixA family protein [Bacillota bacterium]
MAMRVLVCFKVVPDLDQLPPGGWEIEGLRVETGFVKTMLNPYDESALELALRLAESAPGCVKLTALTVGGREAEGYLKTLYALKFDRAVRLESHADLRFSPESVAAAICTFARNNPPDVIIMGRQSGVGDNAATPLLAAEMLGWPCITQVTELKFHGEDWLEVGSMVDGGFLRQLARPPFVAAVGNAPHAYLRVPTLKERLASRDKEVEVLAAAKEPAGCTLEGLAAIDRRRAGIKIDGTSPQEKARKLYEEYLRRWLAEL